MKMVTLKETQPPYTLTLDEAELAEGPVRVVRGEQTIGVLVTPDEYEAFRAWRQAQQQPVPGPQTNEAFEREVAAYERMLPELLQKYRGRVVAIHDEQLVEVGASGESVGDVAKRVYDRLGYISVYVQRVEETPRVYRIGGPRLARR
jgi:hypothetical protein